MRSPFSGNASAAQAVTAQNLWSNAVNLLLAQGTPGVTPQWRNFNVSASGSSRLTQ